MLRQVDMHVSYRRLGMACRGIGNNSYKSPHHIEVKFLVIYVSLYCADPCAYNTYLYVFYFWMILVFLPCEHY